jgi:hypothetical protein
MDNQSTEFPLCPNCNKPMMLARTWSRLGGLPEMHTYQCKSCNVVFTEVATGNGVMPERASALHHETYAAMQ